VTTRKPSSMSFPDWVDQQIREAEAQGAFDNLPGAGKPIPGLGQPRHELAWVADYLRREHVDVAELLPPALAIAKEVEGLRERLLREPTEAAARAVIDELNTRIDAEHARPQTGPVFRVKRVAVEPTLEQWHADRAELERQLAARRPARPPEQQPVVRRGRWRWRRGS